MRLNKRERTELAQLLSAGAETPEDLATDVVELLDDLRGERKLYMAHVNGPAVHVTVGPFTTPRQAYKAAEKASATFGGRGSISFAYTAEGMARLSTAVDTPPLSKGDFAEVQSDVKAFKNGWDGKASTRHRYITEGTPR